MVNRQHSPDGAEREPERSRLLAAYLNDHVTGATGGVALARRTASSQRWSAHVVELSEIADELEADRRSLLRLMRLLGVRPRPERAMLGRLGEYLGRLKPNGSAVARTPLTDAFELELLGIAVAGKAAGWRTLRRLADSDDRIDAAELDELIERAARQAAVLESLRSAAMDLAFGADHGAREPAG